MNVTYVSTVVFLNQKYHSEDGCFTDRNLLVKIL